MGLENANGLLAKLGVEKFFGVKNTAAFENALEKGLSLGLSSNDAVILATAKAQGTKEGAPEAVQLVFPENPVIGRSS